MILKTFGWSFAITAIALVGALLIGGPTAFALVAILIVLEISLSFDNAVVNATILERMNAFWQKIFLTVGILIAVFGMRLVFPLHHRRASPRTWARSRPSSWPSRAAPSTSPAPTPTCCTRHTRASPRSAACSCGMLFLDFIFEDRDISWLTWLERPLARIGKLDQLSVVVAIVALVIAAKAFAEDAGRRHGRRRARRGHLHPGQRSR